MKIAYHRKCADQIWQLLLLIHSTLNFSQLPDRKRSTAASYTAAGFAGEGGGHCGLLLASVLLSHVGKLADRLEQSEKVKSVRSQRNVKYILFAIPSNAPCRPPGGNHCLALLLRPQQCVGCQHRLLLLLILLVPSPSTVPLPSASPNGRLQPGRGLISVGRSGRPLQLLMGQEGARLVEQVEKLPRLNLNGSG